MTAEVLESLDRRGLIADVAEPPGASPLWEYLVELGVTALAVPERAGGAGYGSVELAAVAEVLGRYALPVPVLATGGLFVPAVAAAVGNAGAEVLARIVEGRSATLALPADDPFAVDHGFRLAGGVLEGRCEIVVDLPSAADVALVLDIDGARRLAVLSVEDVTVSPRDSLDPTRPVARLSLSDVPASRAMILDHDPVRGIAIAVIAAAAELVGVADSLLALSVEHAKAREQFGRPIGAFQAVKHRLVDVYVLLERARSHAYYAAAACAGESVDDGVAVRVARRAKAAAGEAALAAARAAVQVHGGTGVTREHAVSRLYLRARQAAVLFGDADRHYSASCAHGLPAAAA